MGSSSPSSSSLPFFALSASGWVLRRLDSGSDCWAPRLAPLRRLGVGTFSSSSSSSSSSAAVAAAARLPRVLRELRFGRSSAAGVLRSSAAGFRPLRRGVTTSSSSSGPDVRRALLTRVAGDSTGELRWPSAVDAAVWAAVELRRVRPPVTAESAAGLAAARRLDRRGAPSVAAGVSSDLPSSVAGASASCFAARAVLRGILLAGSSGSGPQAQIRIGWSTALERR
uniref:Uncharacterized protein n=1 Tax=Rhipicephalus zambeziensis TaxID=60191 RepID=A0A224Y8Z5_9ACAR